MNDVDGLLLATVEELFADHCTIETLEAAKRDGWSAALWKVLEDAEFPLMAVAETSGGSGGRFADAAVMLRAAGAYAAPVPLAETAILAAPVLAQAAAVVPRGPLTVAVTTTSSPLQFETTHGRTAVSGAAARVPYARFAHRIVVLAGEGDDMRAAVVDPSQCLIVPGSNMAGEPRDDVRFQDVVAESIVAAPRGALAEFERRGAVSRALLMAGALRRVLELCVQYATEREQFGRPIGRFQIIQQYLAQIAGEVAAAYAAVDIAVEHIGSEHADFAVAVAKIRTGQAASVVTSLAHQIHGAIGFTGEHQLHHYTTRLWAWRDEFGNESVWSRRLGASVLAAGASDVWTKMTEVLQPRPDPAHSER